MHNDFDIVVVGAGVAGGVFAASQDEHKKILVIERTLSEQERIVGELMQPDGLRALSALNLNHLTDNIDAIPIKGYKLIKGADEFSIEYAEIETKMEGLGLRNGKFLLNIQNELRKKNNVTLLQGNVVDLIEENGKVVGVSYLDENNSQIEARAPLTVVSDGHMSFFRKKLSEPNKKIQSYFMGLVLKNLKIQNPDLGHMIISGAAPILVYPISSTSFRILVDYPGEKPPRMGKKSLDQFKEDVTAILPANMVGAFHEALKEQQVQVMPNHSMKAQAFRKEGAVLLGDSLNMRHPLTGGGMTASFNDILELNKQIKDVNFDNTQEIQKAVETYYINRKKGVETINILANALYKVFRDEDLKDATFNYLRQGGEKSIGPLSILAGINKNKKFLLKHFFKVAMQNPANFITKPKHQIRLYKKALKVIKPVLKDEEKPAIL